MKDTIDLLQSCHRGVVTAVNALEQVIGQVQSRPFRQKLQSTLKRHRQLETEIGNSLYRHEAKAPTPGPMARMGVWMTNELRMMTDADRRDRQIAKLVINGCNTGIQVLSGDLNRFSNASGESRELAGSLVSEEQHLMSALRAYL